MVWHLFRIVTGVLTMRCSMQIIDEIDGALGDGKGAIEVIMKMVCIYLLNKRCVL